MSKSIVIRLGEEREIHWKIMQAAEKLLFVVILTTKLIKISIKGFYLMWEVQW
jgi:hypothetical protein